jgi:hypothetical protein
VICICKKVESRQVNGENPDRSDPNGYGWYNPMHTRKARPPKHEHSYGHARALYARKVQAAFGCIGQFTMSFRDLLLID